jgi:hypothetical protein
MLHSTMKARSAATSTLNLAGRRERWTVATAVVAASLTAASVTLAPPATAAAIDDTETRMIEQGTQVTAAELRQGIDDIKAAGIPFEITTKDDGTEFIVFHFEEGDFGLNVPGTGAGASAAQPGSVQPNLVVGNDSEGNYISFNHTDQVAIRNGATAALLAAIAVISPPVGVVAGILVAWAGTYIADNGACPGNQELWVYFSQGIDGNPSYDKIVCRNVSYPGGG